GGSAIASDQIWRAVERVQESGKPVVVSMGTVAASGGYYVAMGADAILASRASVTGSIGVFGGKIAIADGLRRIGVTPDQIQIGGEVASAYSTERLTDVQRAALVESLERVYDRFTSLAAEGRGMSIEDLQAVAQGRVWTGEDAMAVGLVDEMGGLMAAIDKAKALAEIDIDEDVELRTPYEELTPMEAFASLLGVSAREAKGLQVLSRIVGDDQIIGALQQIQSMERHPLQAAAPPLREN
ncbi:MAG: S49 family peptidase, partial [Pseudomonadota bacterium]